MSDDNFGPWIDWAGGECPIPDAKAGEYQIKVADRYNRTSVNEDWQKWTEHDDVTIIAYRVRLPADDLLGQAIDALRKAKMFIENGTELGYIRLPERGDPALETLPVISAVLAAAAERGL